ncbi:hypothetical protein J2W91_002841 [Paenibacillus amylolyticus]|uniref:Lipoprotein n=1 Tax=Paenibacillus amylolyticus TaxID=1451 RepID=A0AAP5H136_PAEAM|nr:hypothetical protein [Paenibacillus amylolyticus]MDR6724373.1 hypothetical protein [Paenibacillus amylolyticus]
MKKELGVVMLLSVVLLSGCGSDKSETNTQGSGDSSIIQVTTQLEQGSDLNEKLIQSSDDDKVKLFAINEKDNEFQGTTLELNGKTKDFDWTFPAVEGYKPQVYFADVTDDGTEEAVITVFKNRSPGVYLEEIHVVKSDDLSEINIEDPLEIIAEAVETIVQNNKGALTVTVKIGDKQHELVHEGDPDFEYKNELNFGGVVDYNVVSNKIVAKVDGSVGIGEYVCSLTVYYKYDSTTKIFTAGKIEFSLINEKKDN